MKEHLRRLWQSRAPRERMVVTVLAVMIVGVLYVSLLYSASRTRPQLRASVLSLRADAARLEQQAGEIERLRTAPPPAASQTDLRTLIQAQAGSAGLASVLVRIDAPEANRVQVVFGAVAFPDWLNWVVTLNSQNIRLETCRIEALSKPGLVSVTATFARAGRQ
ncbi:MAG: type II secretion system protein M [Betaproteobacteria bacterium]|nr:type II secretion system protein M [Betaproteobacteria bacterium]